MPHPCHCLFIANNAASHHMRHIKLAQSTCVKQPCSALPHTDASLSLFGV